MTAIIAVALIGAACGAELALLAYLLYRDRGQFRHPSGRSGSGPTSRTPRPRAASRLPASGR